ncbi:TetR/AcrR family transcriptional regulator [Streptomyces sp. PTM05]|uniref:TetR/AcrR family transcriptional regulator n=1 Tax=Streptantibioticus parmotrematis TaxID=2873249 RepID=A0ABS7QUH9_9ACTN|nr:TetR/AcrR family transcriptional regulator [Streptantibioticus parmotrematis]MBY8886856.1 TetR/AcrR family transcriptional regulator [Streptantibioticus parmotrematis]
MPTGPRAAKPQASYWLSDRAGAKRRREPEAGSGNGAGLDLDRVVRATIRLLDAEGLARFSMRRLAAALGVTPMSVYWYVDNKDDLLEIALDEINGEIPVPPDDATTTEPEDWRGQLRALATGYRTMLVAHPWASRLMGEYLNAGPRATAFATAAYRVIRRAGLPEDRAPGALAAVHQFAYGFGTVEGRWAERCRTAGTDEDELLREVFDATRDKPELGGLTGLIARHTTGRRDELRERDFAFALDVLIAGIDALRDSADG